MTGSGDVHPIEQGLRDRGYLTRGYETRSGRVSAYAWTDEKDGSCIVQMTDGSRTRAWRMVDAALTAREAPLVETTLDGEA